MIVSRYDGSQVPVYSLSSWIRRSNHLGLTPWTPHDLRRTCATRLAESGVNPFIVQKILNHAPQGITAQVYNQYSYAKEISSALETLGNTVRNKLKT
jgi:integrase